MKCAGSNRKCVVPFLGTCILRGAVSACRFDDVEVFFQSHRAECVGPCKFPTLIAANNTTRVTAIHL